MAVGRTGPGAKTAEILFRDDINTAKAAERRAELLGSLDDKDLDARYQKANPVVSNRYSFRPSKISAQYNGWPRVTELSALAPSNGLMEKRGGALINIDRKTLDKRMRAYLIPSSTGKGTRRLAMDS